MKQNQDQMNSLKLLTQSLLIFLNEQAISIKSFLIFAANSTSALWLSSQTLIMISPLIHLMSGLTHGFALHQKSHQRCGVITRGILSGHFLGYELTQFAN
jgi:hypothetical protein